MLLKVIILIIEVWLCIKSIDCFVLDDRIWEYAPNWIIQIYEKFLIKNVDYFIVNHANMHIHYYT